MKIVSLNPAKMNSTAMATAHAAPPRGSGNEFKEFVRAARDESAPPRAREARAEPVATKSKSEPQARVADRSPSRGAQSRDMADDARAVSDESTVATDDALPTGLAIEPAAILTLELAPLVREIESALASVAPQVAPVDSVTMTENTDAAALPSGAESMVGTDVEYANGEFAEAAPVAQSPARSLDETAAGATFEEQTQNVEATAIEVETAVDDKPAEMAAQNQPKTQANDADGAASSDLARAQAPQIGDFARERSRFDRAPALPLDSSDPLATPDATTPKAEAHATASSAHAPTAPAISAQSATTHFIGTDENTNAPPANAPNGATPVAGASARSGETASAEVARTEATLRADNGDDVGLLRRVHQLVRRAVTHGESEVRIRLEPPQLGRIDVAVRLNGDRVGVAFDVDDETIRSVIGRHTAELEKALGAYGYTAEEISVHLRHPDSGANGSAGRDDTRGGWAANGNEQTLSGEVERDVREALIRHLGALMDLRG